jgi:uncharacterized membrane-anchored protein
MAETSGIQDHPQRYELANEFQARPFAQLQPPEQGSYYAMLSIGIDDAALRGYLVSLCDRYGIAHPREGTNHFSADFGPFRLKWERHTEFVSYTFFHHGEAAQPFERTASTYVDQTLLARMPGQRIVGTHVEILAAGGEDYGPDRLARHFVVDTLCSSQPAGGAARIWTDFCIHEDGFSRLLVKDISMGPRQAGRMVQRMLEIETYGVLAMMALPVARRLDPVITALDSELLAVTHEIGTIGNLEGERKLLRRITDISAAIEEESAAAAYRFSAARAYYQIVVDRVDRLREGRVEGFQTVGEFMDRRLAPAMRNCLSVAERQEALAQRVARAATLLRTRVELELEGQNRDLLKSMNRRAKVQLRLQETVEGLSIVAITYYLVGLIGYGAKALPYAWAVAEVKIIQGAAIPVIALLTWIVFRRWRRRLRILTEKDTTTD